jgi:hypothetical protein
MSHREILRDLLILLLPSLLLGLALPHASDSVLLLVGHVCAFGSAVTIGYLFRKQHGSPGLMLRLFFAKAVMLGLAASLVLIGLALFNEKVVLTSGGDLMLFALFGAVQMAGNCVNVTVSMWIGQWVFGRWSGEGSNKSLERTREG